MNTEEWLLNFRVIDKEIRGLEREYTRALERATSTSSAPMSERVMHSPMNSSEEKMIDVAEYARQVNDALREKRKLRSDIFRVINAVPNGTQRIILRLYYIECMTWEEVAEEMEMSVEYIRGKLKKRGLRAAEKIRERLDI